MSTEVNTKHLFMSQQKLSLKLREYENKKAELNRLIDNGEFEEANRLLLIVKQLHKHVIELSNKIEGIENAIIKAETDNDLENRVVSI